MTSFGAELLAVPKAVPELRSAVREWFGEDVQLCVTELVGNVIRHVGEGVPVAVRVARVDGARVRVEVDDPDPRALPVLLSATGADESGRGLALLGALAVRWGVEVDAEGKTVWCELAGAGVPQAMKGRPVTEEESAAAERERRGIGRIFAERGSGSCSPGLPTAG
ncbi:ATP-binding protein [Streptomyces sp. NPDC002680]|uniref:ATP-binding protein n=1 Tax=Streptomyces sp. NPDC002680 TaxID=3364659 RepID=UPI00369F3D77